MKKAISRRSFLKGAAGVTGAVAASTVLGAPVLAEEEEAVASGSPIEGYVCPEDWLGPKPEIDPALITETLEADVVICGGGHAGTQAALAAAQEGASVIVLEQMDEDVYTCFGDDICSYNSEFLTARGFGGYNLEDIVKEYIIRGAGRVSPEIIRKFVMNSGEMLDNMVSCVPETSNVFDFDDNQCQVQIAYGMPDASYYPLERGGFKAWATTIQTIGTKNPTPVHDRELSRLTELEVYCADASKELGADWHYGTSAVVLVQNENGDVTGVIGQDLDDNYIQFNAKKGVILCCGDFSGNPDMVYNLLTDCNEISLRHGATRDQIAGRGRTGMGQKLGCWAGGMIETQPRPSMNTNGGNPGPWGTTPFLWLNARGKRFMNEAQAGFAKPTIAKQPKGIVAAVCDANFMDVVRVAGLDHGAPNFGQAGVNLGIIDMCEQQTLASAGTGAEGGGAVGIGIINISTVTSDNPRLTKIYSGDTVEEALAYAGYEGEDLENAVKSVEEYNAMCEAGVDSQYGKDAILMQPIKTAPFFVSPAENNGIVNAGLVTLAGLVTDGDMNVLKADFETPIKGLYAAGNCLGQRFGIAYATPSAGASMGMAMTHGRVAGKIVANL